MVKLNIVKERLVYLAPAVQAGWDDESNVHDFEAVKTLGKGSFGVVRKCRHKKTQKIYAIKELNKKDIKDRNMVQQVRNELKIMYSLNHPNIVKLYSHFEDDLNIYLIMEYAERGQLYQNLMTNPAKKFTEIEVAKIVFQIVEAMKYMHQKGIVHRDIKPQNVLLDSHGNTKLADFGWSNYIVSQAKRETYCGTLDYLAPEMIEKSHKHDHAIDLWAIGILIFELCTGTSPFSTNIVSKNQSDMEKEVKHNIMTLNYKVPSFISATCKDLLQKLLVINPSERLSAPGIKQHSWIKTHFVANDTKKANWIEELKNEYSTIMEDKLQADKSEKFFSKEEVYEYSRPDSIINTKKKEKNQQSSKKDQQGSKKDHQNTSFHSQKEEASMHQTHKHTNSNLSGSSSKLSAHSNPSFRHEAKDVEFSGKDLHELLEHIHKLQAKSAEDDKEIQALKAQLSTSHVKCEEKRSEIEVKYVHLRKNYDEKVRRLADSEARVRQLQLQLAKSAPANLKTEPSQPSKRQRN